MTSLPSQITLGGFYATLQTNQDSAAQTAIGAYLASKTALPQR